MDGCGFLGSCTQDCLPTLVEWAWISEGRACIRTQAQSLLLPEASNRLCLFLDVWADRTASEHGGAELEQHYGADSGSTVLSEVGRHVAGGTLFLWENESRGISFSIILMSNMDTEKAQ